MTVSGCISSTKASGWKKGPISDLLNQGWFDQSGCEEKKLVIITRLHSYIRVPVVFGCKMCKDFLNWDQKKKCGCIAFPSLLDRTEFV